MTRGERLFALAFGFMYAYGWRIPVWVIAKVMGWC